MSIVVVILSTEEPGDIDHMIVIRKVPTAVEPNNKLKKLLRMFYQEADRLPDRALIMYHSC